MRKRINDYRNHFFFCLTDILKRYMIIIFFDKLYAAASDDSALPGKRRDCFAAMAGDGKSNERAHGYQAVFSIFSKRDVKTTIAAMAMAISGTGK